MKNKLPEINSVLTSPGSPSATIGELDGEIDLHWDAVKGAKCYVIELSNRNGNSWKQLDIVSLSKHTVTNLRTNATYSFRIAAVNGKQQGPWSETVRKRIS